MSSVLVFLSGTVVFILVVHLEGGNIEDVDGRETDGEDNPGDVEEDAEDGDNKFTFYFSFNGRNSFGFF